MTMKNLFNTDSNWAPVILRVALGSVVFAHGAQKTLGWFGGYGFDGTMQYFTQSVGLPWIVSFSVILLESIGSLALITGLATRLVAIAFTGLAIGIMFTTHTQHGFFMNWSGKQAGEGFEFFLFWIAMAVTLVITGAGRLSIDRLFSNNK